MKKFNLIFLFYSILLGFIVGVVTGSYLIIVHYLINLIWKVIPAALNLKTIFYPLIICGLGGILIGFLQRRDYGYPRTMEQVIGEFKTTEKIKYTHEVRKNLFTALPVLALGASVGPEASLSGILGGMINWVGDRMRLTLERRENLVNMGIGAILSTVFHAPFAGIGSAFDEPTRDFRSNSRKIIIYSITVIFGMIGFIFVKSFFPYDSGFGIHFRCNIEWSWQGFALIPVVMIIGILFGKLFNIVGVWSKNLTKNIHRPVLLAVIGGLLLGTAGIISPYFLFSGEAQLMPFSQQAINQAPWYLLFIAIGKMLITHLGFSLGWRGGVIFPAIFSSAALGFALSAVLPFTPAILISTTVAASLTAIIQKPGLVAGLLLLLLPIEVFPIILAVCYVTYYSLKTLSKQ